MARGSTGKRILFIASGVLLVLILLVIFLPAILSSIIVPGKIEAAVEEALDADAEVAGLELAWFGDQTVGELVLRYPESNDVAANLNVIYHASIWNLILGNIATQHVTITGTAQGALTEQNELTFMQLIRDEPKAEPTQVPSLQVDVAGVAVNIDDRKANRTLRLPRLEGVLALGPNEPLNVDLSSAIEGGDEAQAGAIDINIEGKGLFDVDGFFKPAHASLEGTIEITNAPMLASAAGSVIDSLQVAIASSDLTKRLAIDLRGNATVVHDGQAIAGNVTGQLAIAKLLNDAGEITFDLANLEGELSSENLPTAPLAPMFAGLDIDLPRDIGPTASLAVVISVGSPKNISINMEAANAALAANATIDPDTGAMDVTQALLRTTVQPGLANGLQDALVFAAPAPMMIEVSSAHIPAARADGGIPWNEVTADATLTIAGDVPIRRAGNDENLTMVRDLRIAIESPGLGEYVQLNLNANVEGGELVVDQRITNLTDAERNLAFANLQMQGPITATGIPGDAIAALLPEATATQVATLLEGDFTLDARMQATAEAAFTMTADLTAPRITGQFDVSKNGQTISIGATTIRVQATPELAVALQEGAEAPITIDQPTWLTLEIAPFGIIQQGEGEGEGDGAEWRLASEGAIHATLSTADPVIARNLPGTIMPIGMRDLVINVALNAAGSLTDTAFAYDIDGSTTLYEIEPRELEIAPATFAAAGSLAPDAATGERSHELRSFTLEAKNVAIRRLERVMGRENELISQGFGARADLRVTGKLDDFTADIASSSAKVSVVGGLQGEGAEQVINVQRGEISGPLTPEAWASLTSSADEDRTPQQPAPQRTQLAETANVSLLIASARIPLSLADPETPITPDSFKLDGTLKVDRMAFDLPDGQRSALNGVEVALNSEGLERGIAFTLAGNTDSTVSEEQGVLRGEGRITNLVTEGALAPDDARLTLELDATNLAVALVDVLANQDGLIEAALGSVMEVHVSAKNLSASTGAMTATMQSETARASTTVRGKDGTLIIRKDAPTTATLRVTEALSNELLPRSVHPVFQGATFPEPITFEMPSATIPVPFAENKDKLNGRYTLTIGEVQLATGNVFTRLLKFFDEQQDAVHASVDPIVAEITNGVMRYEKFTMRIDDYRLDFNGNVDFVKSTMNIRTSVPLDALSRTFGELEGYTESISIPIVTHGTIGATKTEIDPSFNLAAELARAGIRGAVKNELQDEINKRLGEEGLGAVNDILGNILGGKRTDKDNPQTAPPTEEKPKE